MNHLKVNEIFENLVRQFWISEGEIAVVNGEDAGLMRDLTAPSVITVLPKKQTEPTALFIDSTKPVYPRLEMS